MVDELLTGGFGHSKDISAGAISENSSQFLRTVDTASRRCSERSSRNRWWSRRCA